MYKKSKMYIREDDSKPRRWTSTVEYTIEEALEILNPDNRWPNTAEKRGAYNRIVKELKKNDA